MPANNGSGRSFLDTISSARRSADEREAATRCSRKAFELEQESRVALTRLKEIKAVLRSRKKPAFNTWSDHTFSWTPSSVGVAPDVATSTLEAASEALKSTTWVAWRSKRALQKDIKSRLQASTLESSSPTESEGRPSDSTVPSAALSLDPTVTPSVLSLFTPEEALWIRESYDLGRKVQASAANVHRLLEEMERVNEETKRLKKGKQLHSYRKIEELLEESQRVLRELRPVMEDMSSGEQQNWDRHLLARKVNPIIPEWSAFLSKVKDAQDAKTE